MGVGNTINASFNSIGEYGILSFFFFSSRRRHTRLQGDWSSDVCSSDLRHRTAPREATDRIKGKCCRNRLEHHDLAVPFLQRFESRGRGAYERFVVAERERGGEGKRGDLRGGRII